MSFVQIIEKKEDLAQTNPFKTFETVDEIFKEIKKHTIKDTVPVRKNTHIFNDLICNVLPEIYEIVEKCAESQFIDTNQIGFYKGFSQILSKHSSFAKRQENALDEDVANEDGLDHDD